jgi:hypothetical protein
VCHSASRDLGPWNNWSISDFRDFASCHTFLAPTTLYPLDKEGDSMSSVSASSIFEAGVRKDPEAPTKATDLFR